MRLLADANIESAIVSWLRSNGHDVLWAADLPPATSDNALIERANTEKRVLLTYDHDFGEMVYLQGRTSVGVVLLRTGLALQADRLEFLVRRWPAVSPQAEGHFTVVSERSTRVRPLPSRPS